MTVSDTPEEAAPMMASTFCDSRRSTVWLAVSVVASPESPLMPVDRLAEHATGSVDVA